MGYVLVLMFLSPPAYSSTPNLVSDINKYSFDSSSEPLGYTVFNSKLYFQTSDGIHSFELWGYDGGNPPNMVADYTLV